MANCFPKLAKNKKEDKTITLIILGLDNSGKTTTTKYMQGESTDGVVPTMGFNKIEMVHDKLNVTMFDLGGGRSIRDIWKSYFSEVYGVVYVVDSSDKLRIEEARVTLTSLLENEQIRGKPVLLLANKQDKESALDEGELVDHLNLVHLVNENRCPCRLELCSAIMVNGKVFEKSIKKGMSWLLTYITENYATLKERVTKDIEVSQKNQKDKENARREKVRRIKEERERDERARGVYESDDENDRGFNKSDPFKPLTANSFQKKQEDEKMKDRNKSTLGKPGQNDTNKLSTRSENSLALVPYKPHGNSPRPLYPTSNSVGNLPSNSNSRPNQLPRLESSNDDREDFYNRDKNSSFLKKGSSLGTIYDDTPYSNNNNIRSTHNRTSKNTRFTDEDDNFDSGYNSRAGATNYDAPKFKARFSENVLSADELQDQNRFNYQSSSARTRNQLYS